MAKLTNVQVIDAERQCLEETVLWHTSKNPIEKPILNAYRAGHTQGFRDAVSYLKLHGALSLAD